jgi:predicted CoA-binding protein
VRHTGLVSQVAATPHRNDPAVIARLLGTPGRWAVVGLSENRARAAYGVAAFLQRLGLPIVPVHPKADTVHGATGYRTLGEIPGPIDVVDVFVRSALAGAVVDQAIAVGAKAVWLQLGVIDEAAAARARAAGLDVVMDACPKIEAPRLGIGLGIGPGPGPGTG